MTQIDLDVQLATECTHLPPLSQLEQWVTAALADSRACAELTIRVVSEAESAALNQQYRGIDRPTNILSFPFEVPPGIDADDPIQNLLGDLVICAEVVAREAQEQNKTLAAHWAHLIVHGVLHLRGYDHLDDSDAEAMEALETRLICALGFPPPYDAEL
ncbi:rRNA maturation RNase YbeY [Chromatium okenii]|uniref:rRNA maturation RNase YbeY n=1 Tax=Chromatium okenii TaxID=61644 RepID=UPI001903602A|nr:rRNA maturation RNase YbeY [Chromatium okenii]MBK1642049.1 rRNA maturation RNase YbeY [Chromatium okenii]